MINRLTAGLLAGVLLFCGQARADAPVATGDVVRATLANGLNVILLPDRLAPVVTSEMIYDVGSNDDPAPGTAHATEHMMFRGTHDVSAGQFADIAARVGATYNAQTTNIFTQYYFTVPSSYAGLIVRLEADRMTGASISEAAWSTERGAIEQEIRGDMSVPGWSAIGKIRGAMFAGTPYAEDAGGTIPSFEKMKASDIAAFYKTWYHPNNATLIVAGDIDPVKLLSQIHDAFDPIPSVTVPAHQKIVALPIASSTIDAGVAELPVPVVGLVYRFPSLDSPDFAAVEVLMTAMQSGRGKVAQLSVDGKALAAIASASAYREVGVGSLVAVGLPGSKSDDVQKLLSGLVADYLASGIPDDLIQTSKTRLLAQQAYRQSSIAGLADVWANAIAVGHNSPDDRYGLISKVTDDDVNRVLRTYMDPTRQLAIQLQPKASASITKADPDAGVENVKYHSDRVEALPAWTIAYFRAPLRAPDEAIPLTQRLKNGLRYGVRRTTMAPVVVLNGSIESADDLNEPLGKDGVSALTDELLVLGTTTYDRKAYQAQLEGVSAHVDLGTVFSLSVPAANFEEGVRLLADGLLHPLFPQDQLENIKRQTASTLVATASLAGTRAAIAETDALYPPGDPRRRRATAATVSSLDERDVHNWYGLTYRPNLTSIAIVGDIDPAKASAIVQKYFGAWRSAGGPGPTFTFPTIAQHRSSSVKVTSETSQDSSVTLSQVLTVHTDRPTDRMALLLANTLLSGRGVGSLLFHDVRTVKGYVYSIDSSMAIGRSESTFTISFSSDPKNTAKAQAEAIAVVRHLQTTTVSDTELQNAKALLLAQQVLPLASYSGVADDMLSDIEYGYTQKRSSAYWSALLTTTPAQIRSAMQRWIDTKRFVRVEVAPGS